MSEDKFNCEYSNIIEGEFVKSQTKEHNLISFIKRWDAITKKVWNMSLNNSQSYELSNFFMEEWDKFMVGDEPKNRHYVLTQLAHDLFIAIIQANNNCRKQFPSFWDRFHKLKLPDLNLIKR
ncbi:MAG: hypothetical protein AABX66_01300 [Nanoarchaeota archaeon]